MKQPKKPTLDQKKQIKSAGLDPDKWSVRNENKQYLYLVDRGMEQRENIIIDKATGEIMKEKSPDSPASISQDRIQMDK